MATPNGVCETCPLEASYEVALELTDEFPEFYKNDKNAVPHVKGYIEQRRVALGKIAQKVSCEGSEHDSDQQLVCPLGGVTKFALELNLGANQQFRNTHSYEIYSNDESSVPKTSRNDGNYL